MSLLKKVTIIILVFLVIAVLAVATVYLIVMRQNVVDVVIPSPQILSAEDEVKIKTFCSSEQSKTSKYKELNSPKTFEPVDETYFQIWKEFFMRNSNISDDYFDEHVKIISDSQPSAQFVYTVKYVIIFDWASVEELDDIPKRDTVSEVKKELAERAERFPHIISTLRGADGTLINKVMLCEDAVKSLQNKNSFLVPEKIDLSNGEPSIVTEHLSSNGVCGNASINLVSEQIDYPSSSCQIYF